eukprot:Nk52_evm47s210 gene=Nk52_evmTU47s210
MEQSRDNAGGDGLDGAPYDPLYSSGGQEHPAGEIPASSDDDGVGTPKFHEESSPEGDRLSFPFEQTP